MVVARIMKKVYFIANRDKRAAGVKKWFKTAELRRAICLAGTPGAADLFVVAGGDGTLLHAIRFFRKYNKPFFGVNCGARGFLLNNIDSPEELARILGNFRECRFIKTYLIKGSFSASRGRGNFYAFNDIYIKAGKGNERICGAVRGTKNFPEQEFDGDGVIISTPQGSTAYNYAAGGAIISLDAEQLAVTSICCRRPIRAVVANQEIVLEITRGEAAVYADNRQVAAKIKKIKIYSSRQAVTLAFKKDYDFEFDRWHV